MPSRKLPPTATPSSTSTPSGAPSQPFTLWDPTGSPWSRKSQTQSRWGPCAPLLRWESFFCVFFVFSCVHFFFSLFVFLLLFFHSATRVCRHVLSLLYPCCPPPLPPPSHQNPRHPCSPDAFYTTTTPPQDTRPCTEAEAALLSEAGLDTKTLWQLKGGEGVAVVPSGPATEEGSTTGKAESNQSVGVCKSLKWPGAVFVAREGKAYTNVYVGYGVVSSAVRPTGRPYEFPLPSEVQKEWVDANAEEDADPTAGMVEAKDVIFEPQAEAEEE